MEKAAADMTIMDDRNSRSRAALNAGLSSRGTVVRISLAAVASATESCPAANQWCQVSVLTSTCMLLVKSPSLVTETRRLRIRRRPALGK